MRGEWQRVGSIVRGGLACAVLAAWGAAAPLHAAPTIESVDPPGAQRGSAVRLTVRGNGLGGKVQVHSKIPGALTELSAEGPGRQYLLEVDSEAEPGAYAFALETADGLSNAWLFGVSAFPEKAEIESRRSRARRNDSADQAQPIAAPAAVHGTLSEGDRDLYKVPLAAGERTVFEVEARRLGSAVDPVLTLWSPAGDAVARNNDAPGIGQDARIAFVPPVGGEYAVEVHDARFSKQKRNFYRLLVGPLDYAEAIFPLGWTAGEPVDVELSGGTLEKPRRVTVEGASAALTGRPTGLPLPFLRGSDPEILEPRGRKRRRLEDGVVVNGRIGAPGERDSYRLPVKAGEEWMIETQAAVLGTSRLYTLLVMRDQDGKELASAGDQPPDELLSNISVRAETFGDPSIGIRVPEGVTELALSVEDLLGRGGPGYAYRLAARKQPADFIVRLNETHVNIPRDGSASVSFTLERRGYDGAIRIVAEGLPEAVAVAGGNIPAEFGGMTTQRNSRQGRLILTAPADAATGRSSVSFYAEGRTEDGQVIRRAVLTSQVVTPVAGQGQRPHRLPAESETIHAVVAEPAPARIELMIPQSLRLIQGLEHDIEWAYRTREGGVQAMSPVQVTNEPAVANLRILGDAKIKPGDPTGKLEMNTTMGTPAMRFDLVLRAQVRHDGVNHTIYSPGITVDVIQGYRVGAPDEPVTVRPGTEFAISGSFSREPEFDSEVVVDAANLPVGVACEASAIGGSPETYSLACRAARDTIAGEYSFEIAPRSVLAGRDEEAVPYNIPPVAAVLVVADSDTIATVR